MSDLFIDPNQHKHTMHQYIFIDTEFTDFINTELISLGAVTEDGTDEFYVEISDTRVSPRSDFVRAVVDPLLEPQTYAKPYAWACFGLVEWLNQLNGDTIDVVVDYTGDAHLFGDMMREGQKHIFLNKTVRCVMMSYAFEGALKERGFVQPSQYQDARRRMDAAITEYFWTDPRQHHALVDAKSNRHGWVKGMEVLK